MWWNVWSEWLLRSRQISRWLDVAPNLELNIGGQVEVGIFRNLEGFPINFETFVGPWVLPRSTNNPGPRPRSRTDTHSKFTGLAHSAKGMERLLCKWFWSSATYARGTKMFHTLHYTSIKVYIRWLYMNVQFVCVSIHFVKIQYLEVIYVAPLLKDRERSYDKHPDQWRATRKYPSVPESSMTSAVAGSHWFTPTTTGTKTGQAASIWSWGLII